MKSNVLPANDLSGFEVQNLQGKNIGKIQDLMIDVQTGRVLYAVLSFGGFMGIGDDYFAIPLEALILSDAKEDLVKIDIDKEILKDAPGFDKDNWPTHADYEFVNTVYDYYGYEHRPSAPQI